MKAAALSTLALMSGVQGSLPTGEPVSQFQDVLHHKITETPQQAQELTHAQNDRNMKGNILSLAAVGIAAGAERYAQHMDNLARRADKTRRQINGVHWGETFEVSDGRKIDFKK